MQMEEGG